ncbi:MAG: DinB family protein [Flavobacterium sp.]|nr:DinB family protein [Flavobacterium sp.]
MKKLELLLDELERYIPSLEKTNLEVSTASIGWQIDHCLIVINRVSNHLKDSNHDDYKWKFNLIRTLIFTLNTIKRGKVQAPKVALPEGEITVESLKQKINTSKTNVAEIQLLNKNCFFPHPYFGDLNIKQTQKFLVLHTTHHLKIIRDISNK